MIVGFEEGIAHTVLSYLHACMNLQTSFVNCPIHCTSITFHVLSIFLELQFKIIMVQKSSPPGTSTLSRSASERRREKAAREASDSTKETLEKDQQGENKKNMTAIVSGHP